MESRGGKLGANLAIELWIINIDPVNLLYNFHNNVKFIFLVDYEWAKHMQEWQLKFTLLDTYTAEFLQKKITSYFQQILNSII